MSMGTSNADATISVTPRAASASIRNPTEAALVATSIAGLIPIAAPDAALPASGPQTITASEAMEPRELIYASQLRLAQGSFDEHDPHARIASIHTAMAQADAVALSQRIVRASTQSTTTVFDEIISRNLSALVVYEDDDVVAFHDRVPQAPVHIVVSPVTPQIIECIYYKNKRIGFMTVLNLSDGDCDRGQSGVIAMMGCSR